VCVRLYNPAKRWSIFSAIGVAPDGVTKSPGLNLALEGLRKRCAQRKAFPAEIAPLRQ